MEITIKDGGTLGIEKFPDRKRKALYRMRGSQIMPVAYFITDEDSEWVERFLIKICKMINKKIKEGTW